MAHACLQMLLFRREGAKPAWRCFLSWRACPASLAFTGCFISCTHWCAASGHPGWGDQRWAKPWSSCQYSIPNMDNFYWFSAQPSENCRHLQWQWLNALLQSHLREVASLDTQELQTQIATSGAPRYIQSLLQGALTSQPASYGARAWRWPWRHLWEWLIEMTNSKIVWLNTNGRPFPSEGFFTTIQSRIHMKQNAHRMSWLVHVQEKHRIGSPQIHSEKMR